MAENATNGASVVLLAGWDQLRRRIERLRDGVMDENADTYHYPEERDDVAALCDAVLALIEAAQPDTGET